MYLVFPAVWLPMLLDRVIAWSSRASTAARCARPPPAVRLAANSWHCEPIEPPTPNTIARFYRRMAEHKTYPVSLILLCCRRFRSAPRTYFLPLRQICLFLTQWGKLSSGRASKACDMITIPTIIRHILSQQFRYIRQLAMVKMRKLVCPLMAWRL